MLSHLWIKGYDGVVRFLLRLQQHQLKYNSDSNLIYKFFRSQRYIYDNVCN